MSKSRRTGIRRSIEKLLFPELLVRGFEQSPATQDSQLEPIGRFLRRAQGVEIVVIRFNKNRTSHFNFHIARAISEKVAWGPYVGLCVAVVLSIFFGGIWVIGWMVRQL